MRTESRKPDAFAALASSTRRQRVAGTLAAVLAVVLAGLAAMTIYAALLQGDFRRDVFSKAEAVAGSLGEKVAVAVNADIPLDRLRGVEAVLDEVVHLDPDVIYAEIASSESGVIARSGSREDTEPVQATVRVGAETGESAEVRVALRAPAFAVLALRGLPELLLGVGGAAALAAALAWWALGILIEKRTLRLARDMAAVAADPLAPYSPPHGGWDELAEAFRRVAALREQVATAEYVFRTWGRIVRDSHVDEAVKERIDRALVEGGARLPEDEADKRRDEPPDGREPQIRAA